MNSREEKPKTSQEIPAADTGIPQRAAANDAAEAQAEALWSAFQKSRTTENKNRLVVHYVPLVNRIVSRIVPMYTAGTSFEDLVGYGVLGLIDAVDKYAPDRNVKFETYAVKRIKGEIIDSMRRQDWAPASLRSRIKQIDKAYEQMEANGLDVTDEDVAEYLGLDVRQVRAASEKAYMFNVLHFETLISSAVEGGETYLDAMPGRDASDHPDRMLEKQELKKAIAQIINGLPEKERQIVTLYYYEELMLKDIAALLNVTPARVSQIHARALEKIKKGVQNYMEPTK